MFPCRRTAFTTMLVVAGLTLEVARVVPTARAGTNVWTSNGLSGQQVRVLAIDPATPTTIYAVEDRADGSRDTLLKSIDGGATWNAAMTGLTPKYFLAVLIDPSTPSTLYVGTEVGVFKSTDGAATWSAASTGLQYPVLALAIDPTTPTTLYAAGATYGVSTSTDGGATWTTAVFAISPFPPGFVDALAIVGTSPKTIYAGTKYSSTSGLYASTDGGATWTVPIGGSPFSIDVYTLKHDPADPTVLYAGTSDGLYRSMTFGGTTTWDFVSRPPYTAVTDLVIDPADSTTMYATNGGGVFQSTTSGGSWNTIDSGLTNVLTYALAVDATSPGTVYAGTSDGVFSIQPIPVTVPTPTAPVATPRPLDDFTCYTSAERRGAVAFHGIDNPPGVALTDASGSSTVGIRKPTFLCAPTSVRGANPTAPSHPAHLAGYPIKLADPPVSRAEILVTDAFNATGLFVETTKRASLLAATAASLDAPPTTPALGTDHFECYKVAAAPDKSRFAAVDGVTLTDRFGSMTVTLTRPELLCNPVDVHGANPTAPSHPKHLMCYRVMQTDAVKFAKLEKLFIENGFGPETVDAKKPSLLCVSALIGP